MNKSQALAQLMEAQLAEEAAGHTDRIPNANTVESWLMIGLSGAVTMLLRLTTAGLPMSEWWLGQIDDCINRLDTVRKVQRGKSQ